MNTVLKTKTNIFILIMALISFELNARPISFLNEDKILVYPEKTKDNEDLILIDENGKKVVLSELKGKVVFVNFWATWCRPCVEEMPTISNL